MSRTQNLQVNDYMSFFKHQTVFLTGGTGALGGCLLYKLTTTVPVKKIFVLVRSIPKAKVTWKTTLPNHIESMMATGKIVLMVGDMTCSHFGLKKGDLTQLESETTIVIHSVSTPCTQRQDSD
jgi:fatty acyl-CoA reductase